MAKQSIQQVKQRFEIIGTSPELDRAIDIALQVAPTDLSVLITGESGVGKENFPSMDHILLLTAALFLKVQLILNCLVMKRDLLQVQQVHVKDILK